MTNHLWLNALIVLGIIGTAEETVRRLVLKPIRRAQEKLDRFLATWHGEPARDGLPARPGLVDRVIAIEYQTHNNGGGSMKDGVDKSVRLAQEVKTALDEHIADSNRRIEQGEQDKHELQTAIANLSAAMPVVAASTPPSEDLT